jgi:leucyl/phenylalanyl-tRNA--protein transferase
MTLARGDAPFWIDPESRDIDFPDVELALKEPDGLLAVGGDLSVPRLVQAYRQGIFPWYGPGQPILWWSPDPRLVLYPERLHVSRSLARVVKKKVFEVTMDTAFESVIHACAGPRADDSGTWITPEMKQAYVELYHQGHAHSIECWQGGQLVGGLYGVSVGRMFFGESMFAAASDASKVALVRLARQLARWDFHLIDCQVHTSHLVTLGANTMSRNEFVYVLKQACALPGPESPWVFDNPGS